MSDGKPCQIDDGCRPKQNNSQRQTMQKHHASNDKSTCGVPTRKRLSVLFRSFVQGNNPRAAALVRA